MDAQVFFKENTAKLLEGDIDSLYERLSTLEVELDADPLIFGPKRLQEKIHNLRKSLTECEKIFLGYSQKLHHAKRTRRAMLASFDLAKKYLISTDAEVRAGRNVSDRDAIAAVKLKDEWLQVQQADQDVEDLEALMIVIKAKRSDLKDMQGRLRDQVRLCQTEIDLGGTWGSQVLSAPSLRGGRISDNHINALIASVDAEVNLSDLEELPSELFGEVEEKTAPTPKPVTFPKESKLSTPSKIEIPDSDLDDLFENPVSEIGDILPGESRDFDHDLSLIPTFNTKKVAKSIVADEDLLLDLFN